MEAASLSRAEAAEELLVWRPVPHAHPGNEARCYLRLIDSCITQLKAQGPSWTCNESKEEEDEEHILVQGVGSRVLCLEVRGEE